MNEQVIGNYAIQLLEPLKLLKMPFSNSSETKASSMFQLLRLRVPGAPEHPHPEVPYFLGSDRGRTGQAEQEELTVSFIGLRWGV